MTDLPECSICAEEIQNLEWVCKTECNHIYHYKCMRNWVNACKRPPFSSEQSCPNCRKVINGEIKRSMFCTPSQIQHVRDIVTRIHNNPEAQKIIKDLIDNPYKFPI